MCAFFDNRDKCLGYSAPAKYVVIEKADPVTVTASLNTPQCGFDVKGEINLSNKLLKYSFNSRRTGSWHL